MAENEFDIGIGTEVDLKTLEKALKNIEKELKNSGKKLNNEANKSNKGISDSFKNAASDITKAISGIDFTKLIIPGAAIGVTIAALVKLKGALDDMAAAWREQEQAEVALANAARNNPYLNDRAVNQLTKFADEMQRVTGIDNVLVLQQQTRLASLGRDQQEIQKILTTAADMAAAGIMDFDSAVTELNSSLNGMVRTSGRLYPELRNLSKEALASGEAIDIIAEKVAGSSAAAMETGAGSVLAYQNALGDLRKQFGEDWERATSGLRAALTGFVNRVVEARNTSRELKAALDILAEDRPLGDMDRMGAVITRNNDRIRVSTNLITDYTKRLEDFRELAARPTAMYSYAPDIANLERLINQEEQRIDTLRASNEAERRKIQIQEEIAAAIELTNRAYELRPESERVIRARLVALQAERDANQAIEENNARAGLEARRRAATAAEVAKQEIRIYENQQEAIRLREENHRLLDLEIEKIYRKARLEGKSINDLEVQQQVLNAQVQAYENLLSAAQEYMSTLTDAEVEAFLGDQFNQLQRTWAAYERQAETKKYNDEQEKQRLSDLANQQRQLQSELDRILASATAQADREEQLKAEQDFQKQLADLRAKGTRAALEEANRLEREYLENRAKETAEAQRYALEASYQNQLDIANELLEEELKAFEGNEEIKADIRRRFATEQEIIESSRIRAEVEIERALQAELLNIREAAAEEYQEAERRRHQERLAMIQEYLNAASSIASSISSIWTNTIEWEKEQKIKANNEMIQSDEERAGKEEKILMEAAYETYKAKLFEWSTNVTMATANAAMAVLNALTTTPFPVGLAMSILAGTMGGLQVASIISARPRPPTFHGGGAITGRGEVPIIGMAGEAVITPRDFNNMRQVTAALAEMTSSKGGGGMTVEPQVTVNNTVSDQVSTNVRYDPEGLIIDIVGKALSNGSLDNSLALQQQNQRGSDITTW